jgi:small nuclear ribonucleoprotein (snRNP)-like protein
MPVNPDNFEQYGKMKEPRRKKDMKEYEGEKKEEPKKEEGKKRRSFEFWGLLDKKEVSIELVSGEKFNGTLRTNFENKYDVLLHEGHSDKIATYLIRRDVITMVKVEGEEIFPVLKNREG